MKNLFLFFNKIKFFLFFIVLQLIVFNVVVTKTDYQKSGILNSSAKVSGWFYSLKNQFSSYWNLRDENKILANQNAQLKQESFHNYTIVSSNSIKVVNDIYKKQYLFQPAVVINNTTNKKKNTITMDVGRNKGIRPEMGVVSSRGIVGFTRNVSGHYSTAMSLMNTEMNIPVIPLKDSCQGTLFWDFNDGVNVVSVKGIPVYYKLKVGDTIVTQGGAGIFPKGETVGVIEKKLKQIGSNNWLLKVKTSVDFRVINHVFLIENLYKEELDSLQNPLPE